jgi:hypothetical protein
MIEDDVIELIYEVKPLGGRPVHVVSASEDELKRFERVHNLVLPEEIKSWFRRCNGGSVNPGGLFSLFNKEGVDSLDWYFKQYPDWKAKGWFPIASDGCGDLYVFAAQITTPGSGGHPVFFLDQSDFSKPRYPVASGLWKFLYFLLENELLHDKGLDGYWPFDKEAVLAVDPDLAQCPIVPLPWEIDEMN